ncbi:hypothetical protein P3S68_028107 [Capsicum galapagoense]
MESHQASKLDTSGTAKVVISCFEQLGISFNMDEGPQYVCTNFWTFDCKTCNGIQDVKMYSSDSSCIREFHRVKSVFMAKFTSQEVESLQKSYNQWLPNNSYVDKVRDLIKTVYVDKRYAAAESSDRPPRDTQV